MPQGFVHNRFHKAVILIVIPSTIYLAYYNLIFSLAYLFGYLSGRYVDPDWDVMAISHSEGSAVKELPLIGYYIYGVSSIYGGIFRKYHRSIITHFPVLSTLIRIIFLYWWIVFLYIKEYLILYPFHLEIFFGYWLGLSLSDFVHYLADVIWSDDSKRFKEGE